MFLLIALYVYDEFSFDKLCPDSDRIVRVHSEMNRTGDVMKERLRTLDEKLFKIGEWYFEGKLDDNSYRRLTEPFELQATQLKIEPREIEMVNESLSEGSKVACDLFELLRVAWSRIRNEANLDAANDFLSSIIPEKIVYDNKSTRTPFGCVTKGLFTSKTKKMLNAGSFSVPPSCKAALSGFEPETPYSRVKSIRSKWALLRS